jgi:hypothetical protein
MAEVVRGSFWSTKATPSAPAAAPKYSSKLKEKLWVRSIGVEFQQAPLLPPAFCVRLTVVPLPNVASPTTTQLGQVWDMARPKPKHKKTATKKISLVFLAINFLREI